MATGAILFDYGGTLVSFSFPRQPLLAVLDEARPEIAAAAGRPVPAAAELMTAVLEPLETDLDTLGEDEVDYMDLYAAAWRRAGLDLPRDLLWRILDREQTCWDAAVRVAEGAATVLARLRAAGLRLAIASNAPFPPPMMHRQLARTGLGPLVDAAVFSSEVGRRKPAPELYLAALERVGVAPERALYVGDQVEEDLNGPLRVGMRAVLCRALARVPPPPGVPAIDSLAGLEGLL